MSSGRRSVARGPSYVGSTSPATHAEEIFRFRSSGRQAGLYAQILSDRTNISLFERGRGSGWFIVVGDSMARKVEGIRGKAKV